MEGGSESLCDFFELLEDVELQVTRFRIEPPHKVHHVCSTVSGGTEETQRGADKGPDHVLQVRLGFRFDPVESLKTIPVDRLDPPRKDSFHERFLVAEVIVDGGEVRSRFARDGAKRGAAEPVQGEKPFGRIQEFDAGVGG